MDDFYEWMILERKLAKGSARVYRSHAKAVLAAAPEEGVTPEFLSEYMEVNPARRTPYRVFREWAQETHGMKLPELPHRPSGRRPKYKREKEDVEVVEEVPEAVLDALSELLQGSITPKIVSKLMWGHLVHSSAKHRYECPTPGDVETLTILPEAYVEVLKDWAKPAPGKELYTPLVPRKPGSLKPINWSWLELTLAVRRQSQGTY